MRDLSKIRSLISKPKTLQQWAFRRPFQCVEYGAEGEGLTVEQVDPAHANKRCSNSGTTPEKNRDGEAFLRCGYKM